ncbi:hypothetical protein CCACVL1_03021 [Corchorus capsularis]|uniref:DUF7812 domain-containing protein n=1 Tax=Corchorus capsularis TaxID=210143 RepID=A0A1R3K3R0_COCAP|nr:hypothetical protein CCACVL1_03021 [Corchorus capsularis]
MEGLYLLLLNLCCSNSEANLNFSETEFNFMEFNIKFKDIHEISNVLFDKLNAKFNELFAALDDFPAHQGRGQSICHDNVKATVKELTLLLRCCVAAFKLLGLDQKLIIEKGRLLLGILKRCLSVEFKGENGKSRTSFEKQDSHECMHVDDDGTTYIADHLVTSICFSEPSNPFHAILCAVLEVFADELLMHESVRQYLLLVDSRSCPNEYLFAHHYGPGNIGSVLEVISAHFFLSISDDQAYKNFLNRLFPLPDNNFRVPEMTLTTALSLLLNPIMLSAPKMFQAYLILLVSEIIGISMSFEHIVPSSDLTSCLLVFERSVALYTRHMSNLHVKGYPMVGDDSFVKSHFLTSSSQMDFDSCLLPATKEKVHNLIASCEKLWNSYLSNTLLKERSDLVAASVAYTKEGLHVFEDSLRDEILSILSCIILRGSSDDVDDTVLHNKENTSPQDICLLASILKLMSSSLSQALKILRQGKTPGSLKTLENIASSKEYDFMAATFNCFKQFSIRLPVQNFLLDMMKIKPTRHKKSKWMLFHFSGLLSLSYATGLEFLVKNCIFTLMVLLNLFIFEEGDLLALGSLLSSGVKSSSPKSCIEVGKSVSHSTTRKVHVKRESSRAVALKFQKIRTLYLGMDCRTNSTKRPQEYPRSSENGPFVNHVESALSIEQNTGKTCNGEILLMCMVKGHEKVSDFDDLADFIECKQGRDYADWLKGRERFRLRRYEKLEKVRWKRKRRAYQNRL